GGRADIGFDVGVPCSHRLCGTVSAGHWLVWAGRATGHADCLVTLAGIAVGHDGDYRCALPGWTVPACAALGVGQCRHSDGDTTVAARLYGTLTLRQPICQYG